MKKLILSLLFAFSCAAMFAESISLTDATEDGIPKGWKAYGKNGVCKVENGALRITDKDAKSEWGIAKTVPIAKPGKYVFSVEVSVPEGGNVKGNVKAFLLGKEEESLRFVRPLQQSKAGRVRQGEFDHRDHRSRIQDGHALHLQLLRGDLRLPRPERGILRRRITTRNAPGSGGFFCHKEFSLC